MADLSAALACQSFANDKQQQRLQQPEVEQSQNAFAVSGSLKISSVACPRPGVSVWDAGRVINSSVAAGCSSNISNHGRSRASPIAPAPMSDPAKQQPLSSSAQAYRQVTTGDRTHRNAAEPVPPHSVAGSGGGCGRRPAWGRVTAGQQNSDDEEDFDDRPGDGHRFDDAEDDPESSGRLPNHLLDEIWTDMGVDAMDLDFYDFSADAGGEPLASTSADVKPPSSGAAHWSPGPTSASGVACNVPPSVALPAAAASAPVGSLDIQRVDAGAEVRRDRTVDPVRPAPPLGQLGTSGSLEWDAKDDFGQTSQRSGQESGQGAACREQRQQQQHQNERENIVDRKDAVFTEVAVDGASPNGPRRAGSSAPPSNLVGTAAAGVSRENSVSPSASASVTSALTSGTSPGDPANDRLNGEAAAMRSTSDSLAAIAKLTRSISEAGSAGRSGSSDSGTVLDTAAPYACRTAPSAPDSCTPAPSPGTASCDSGSRSPAVHSPGQFGSGVAQDTAYGGSGSGPASRRAALPGRCSATQLSGNLRATEQLACELMGPQPAGASGSSGAQHSRSQAMRTRGECSPYHVPSRPHSGGGGSSCTCTAACAPSGLMAAPYHQQVSACNGRHENGRPLLGQAMPVAATGYQPYSSDNHGRHPAAVASDGHRVGAAGLSASMQSSNGACFAPPHAWRHHPARSSSIPDDLAMDEHTEPDRTINFSEKSQVPNYYQVPEHGGYSSGAAPAGISFNLSLGGAARSLQAPSQQQQHNPRWPAQPMPPSASLHQQQQSWQPAAGLPQAWQQQQPFFPSGMPSLAPTDGLQSAVAQQPEQQQQPAHHVASSQPFTSGYNSLGHHLPMQQLQLSRPDAAAVTTFARGTVMHNAHLTNSVSEEPGMGSFQPKMGPTLPGSQAGADALSAADAPESFAARPQPGASSTHQQPQQPPLPGTHCFMQRLIVAERSNAFRSHPLFPLLRDLVVAEMSFDDPSFPHQLIRDLPVDFEKLLHNYLARNPVLVRGVPPANQSVESVVMDALRYAHWSLIEKLQVRASTTSCDGSYAAKTQPPPPPPPGYAAVSSAAAAGGGSACNGFDSSEPQRWMQARFGLQDAAASGQSTGAQAAAAFSVAAGRAAAADLMYGGRDGLKAENCNGVTAHSATQQCQMVRYENDAGRANYYSPIERPADSSNTVGGGINSLASSQGAASGTAGLANGHVARNDTPGRDVLLEQVQLQQRLQLQQMAAGGRSGAERSQGNSHFYAVPLVGGDRPALQPARFGSSAVSASTHQAGGFGAYPVNGDIEASAQRARNGPLSERLSQQHHGYRQSPPSADVASCRHGQATGAAAAGHMDSPSGSDASMSAEALSPPSPSAMRMSSFAAAASLRQQQQELQQRAIVARYDRNLGSNGASPAASMMSSMVSDGTGSAAAASTAARKHQSLPKEAVNLMTEWLREHQDKPYPNDDEKCAMIKQTGLSMQQINYWFTNARRRLLRRWQQGSADGQPPVDC